MMVLFVMLVMMMLVVVLAVRYVHEVVKRWSLLFVWHNVFDESDADVLAEGILDLSVGNILVA